MRLYVPAIVAALSSFLLSACGGGTPASGPAPVPAAHITKPVVNSVVVTAVHGSKPIPHLEISLTRRTWPKGKLISKGATGMKGRVMLSGDWTAQEVICAGGKYYTRSGYSIRYKCEQPFPKTLKLDF